MADEAIRAEKLNFGYHNRPVLRSVSFTIAPGQFVGVIGPNGAGKSTLVKILAGYLKPGSGDVRIFGRSLARIGRGEAARTVAVVPQEVNFFFPYRVEDFVLLGRHPHLAPLGFESENDRLIAYRAMEETDTFVLRERSVLELSGGEKQRVILAAALAQQTDILLLDEPTSSLDLRYQIEINSILARLNESEGLTVVVVTHDLNLAALFCGRLLLLSEGKLAADGPPDLIITAEMIERFYGARVTAGRDQNSGAPYVLPARKKEQ